MTSRPRAGGERESAPLTVLHVVSPAPVGGLEGVVATLADEHTGAGCRVAVLAVLSGDETAEPFLDALSEAGAEVEVARIRRRGYLTERKRVRRVCERLDPHVVHTHGYRPDVVDGGVARSLGIPTVSTVHGFIGGTWKSRLYERIQRFALRRFDAVVAVSSPLARELGGAGVPADRIHLIPNALPRRPGSLPEARARRELGVAEDAFHVGWVGRVSAEKGPDVLLDAVKGLDWPDLTVSMIGDGPDREELEARTRRNGAGAGVRWHGRIPDAARLFSAFDVFVLSSRTEGTPLVLLEAMDAGVPVVATAVGGVPDSVGEEAALLVPPERPEELARALRRTRERPERARARVRAARRRVDDRFAPGPWAEAYRELYRSLTPRPKRR